MDISSISPLSQYVNNFVIKFSGDLLWPLPGARSPETGPRGPFPGASAAAGRGALPFHHGAPPFPYINEGNDKGKKEDFGLFF